MSRFTALARKLHPWRWFLLSLFILFLLPLLPLGYLTWQYHAVKPRPTRNYSAEFNEAILNLPEPSRAWTSYRPILREADWPQNPDLQTAIDFAAANPALLARIRQASKIETLGYLLSDGTAEDARPSENPTPPSENPLLLAVHLSPGDELLKLAMYLHLQGSWVAAGDWELTTRNIIAIVNIAEQLDELPFAVAHVRSLQVYRLAVELLLRMMAFPESLTEDQLVAITDGLSRYRGGAIKPRLEGERWVFADILQRAYVLDEQGDGYLHLPSLRATGDFEQLSWPEYLTAPLARGKFATFTQIQAEHQRLMDLADREFSLPAWQLGSSTLHAELDQLADDQRFLLLTMIFPDLVNYYVATERAAESRDVAEIAIALRRFVNDNGVLPPSLDALVPSYLPEIPRNRFDGQPYRSRLTDEGLVIYSVGFDGRDDEAETAYGLPNILYDGTWSIFFDDSVTLSDRDSIYASWWRKLSGGTVLASGDIIHHLQPVPRRAPPRVLGIDGMAPGARGPRNEAMKALP